MTLDELKQKEDKIKIVIVVDMLDDVDCDVAYVYLYRAYDDKRISDCEMRLARAPFEGTGTK